MTSKMKKTYLFEYIDVKQKMHLLQKKMFSYAHFPEDTLNTGGFSNFILETLSKKL